MAWRTITDQQGRKWKIDWAGINRVAHAFAYMKAFTTCARLGNSANFGLKSVYFDNAEMKALTRRYFAEETAHLNTFLSYDGRWTYKDLAKLREATTIWRQQRSEMFVGAEQSAARHDAAMVFGKLAAEAARDTCVATLTILAMPAGGGVSLLALGITGTGNFLCKYQDTGNVNAALWAGASNMALCGFGTVTNALQGSQKVLGVAGGICLDSSFEMVGAAVEGKNPTDAFVAGATKAFTGALGAGVDASKINARVSEMAKKAFAGTPTRAADGLGDFMAEGVKKGGEKATGAAVDELRARSKQGQSTAPVNENAYHYIKQVAMCPV